MKTTTDIFTGRRFRYNTTVEYGGFIVPARVTKTTATHLHPSRVQKKLLAELNPTNSLTK